MGLTFTEALADLAPGLQLAREVEAAVSALPPKETAKPSDYLKLAATVLTAACPLADAVVEQIKS